MPPINIQVAGDFCDFCVCCYNFDLHAEPACYNLLEDSVEWNAFQADAFEQILKTGSFNTNPGKEPLSYAQWSQKPGIKDFCDDFRERFKDKSAPGGRVADLWPSIVDYMTDHANCHPQLHFVSEEAPENQTVQGSVYANGNSINAFIEVLTGTI